jgi:micrococcal nuclease
LVKARLIGVDTPETVHPSKPVEHYGREASLFLTNLLKGESVYAVYDQERTDRYGRTLAYLFRAPDGLFVNAEIIRQGYGHAYTRFPFRHMELF